MAEGQDQVAQPPDTAFGIGSALSIPAAGDPDPCSRGFYLRITTDPIIESMYREMFDELSRWMRLDEQDVANVRALAPFARGIISEVVNRFYDELLLHEGARAVLTGGAEQIRQLHGKLSSWLREMFEQEYDEDYFRNRQRVGIAHVRVGLPQHYMITTMELIWRELDTRLRRKRIPHADVKLRSLHKIVMLELALMLESYKDSYSDQVRQVEREAVEEKLTRAEHLAQIGQLAASLAHEIKNPLAGISGAIQIIRDDMDPEDIHHPILSEILGQIGRLDATVKDLLQYARPSPPKAAKVPLDAVAKRVMTVLQEEPALHGVRLHLDAASPDTTVMADEGQLEQLLLNLIINAAHASEENGRVTIRVERDTDRIHLRVLDRGRGMSEEVKARAFEPFFTTKAKGTGLGLTICKRIAEANNGTISLISQLGRGTTVTVSFPTAVSGPAKG